MALLPKAILPTKGVSVRRNDRDERGIDAKPSEPQVGQLFHTEVYISITFATYAGNLLRSYPKIKSLVESQVFCQLPQNQKLK
jgi:hypothetical protein